MAAPEIAKVKARLKEAKEHHAEWVAEKKRADKDYHGGTAPR
jgi:hypothetical protein